MKVEKHQDYVITHERIVDLFFIEEFKNNFNIIFNQEEYSYFSISGKLKVWLELLGHYGHLEDYKKFRERAYQFMNNELNFFKTTMKSLGLDIFSQIAYDNFYFSFENKLDLTKGDGFERYFKKEADLKKVIQENLAFYFEQCSVKSEVKVNNGICDLYVKYNEGKPTAIELKKGRAKRKDIYQTFEYKSKDIDVAIIAKGFDDKVLELAKELGVSCYYYSIETSDIPECMVIDKAQLDEGIEFDILLESIKENQHFDIYYDFFVSLADLNEYKEAIESKANYLMEQLYEHLNKIKEMYFQE